jgi:hypothetical protein
MMQGVVFILGRKWIMLAVISSTTSGSGGRWLLMLSFKLSKASLETYS